ncbi:FHA domain-containing protein, partial [Thiolapillus sp.]
QGNSTTPTEHAATVEIAISDVNALKKLRKRKKLGQLAPTEPGRQSEPYILNDIHCSLGRARDADIHVGGWFAPKTAAVIVRQHNAYHLIPQKRGKVKINGLPITAESVLKPGDLISVRGKEYLFQYTSSHGN